MAMAVRATTLERGARSVDGTAERESRPRVLVIDDERIIRELLVEHLTEEGFGVDAADTIARGRVCMRESGRPDVIVLDLMLPERTGWEFLRDRRENPLLARIPVVVISATTPDRLVLAAQLGADAQLSKPFDLDQLTEVVRSFVAA